MPSCIAATCTACCSSACREQPAASTLRTGSEVVGYEQDGSGVSARLASGERVTGAALIGADGLWSNIRKQVVGDGPPRVSGHTTYRSVIPTEQMPRGSALERRHACGPGRSATSSTTRCSGWKVFNLVVTYHNDAPEPGRRRARWRIEEVLRGFEHVAPAGRRTSSGTAPTGSCGCCATATRWSAGSTAGSRCSATRRIPMHAVLRARRLHGDGGRGLPGRTRVGSNGRTVVPAALEAYRSQRVLRTARVQLQSRAIGEHIYHPSGAHALLRNEIMSAKKPEQWYDGLAWLYGGTGLDAA